MMPDHTSSVSYDGGSSMASGSSRGHASHPHHSAQAQAPPPHHPAYAQPNTSPYGHSPPMTNSSDTSPQSHRHSTSGPSPSGTTATGKKRRKPYSRVTCSECRRRKIACVPSEPDPDACKRCYKMNLHCTLAEEKAMNGGEGKKKRRRRKATDGDQAAGGQSQQQQGGEGDHDDDDDEDDDDEDEVEDVKPIGRQQQQQQQNPSPTSASGPSVRGPRPSISKSVAASDARSPSKVTGSLPPTSYPMARPLSNPSAPPAFSRPLQPKYQAEQATSSHHPMTSGTSQPTSHPTAAAAAAGNSGEDIDFIYSFKEGESRPTAPSTVAARSAAATALTGKSNPPKSAAAERASAQNTMLVHGCPLWVYSDLMARFNLLSGEGSGSKGKSVVKMDSADLNAKLMDLNKQVVDEMDDILEDARLTMPHLPLLSTLMTAQSTRYDSPRTLLMALLVFIATNGGDATHLTISGVSKSLLTEIKSYLTHQALDCIMFSPTKSREIVMAAELMAVYDPLLGRQGNNGRLETSRFILPTSFYLDLAIAFAYRIGLAASTKTLQRWYKEQSSNKSKVTVPDHIREALLDATMWVSLELHIAELNRNLQGVTNCFAKDWRPLWPGASEGLDAGNADPSPSYSSILRYCSERLPGTNGPKGSFNPSLGSRLGMVNMAFRRDGLGLLQQVLGALYNGIPDVNKIDHYYTELEEDLAHRLKHSADETQEKMVQTSKVSAPDRLEHLANDVLERELAWMKHFFGGYCFAILLWLPKLTNKPSDLASMSLLDQAMPKPKTAGEDPTSFHEQGIHGSDMAQSVIDAIKNHKSDPESMMEGGNASTARRPSEMSSFEFLIKHNPEHEVGLQKWMTLSLETTSSNRLRSANVHRISTNSRTIYGCKEIIENHATRRRGWGKVGEGVDIHIALLRKTCDHFIRKDHVLDKSLAKLAKILERILDSWRKTPGSDGKDAKEGLDGKRPSGSTRRPSERASVSSGQGRKSSTPAMSAIRTQQQPDEWSSSSMMPASAPAQQQGFPGQQQGYGTGFPGFGGLQQQQQGMVQPPRHPGQQQQQYGPLPTSHPAQMGGYPMGPQSAGPLGSSNAPMPTSDYPGMTGYPQSHSGNGGNMFPPPLPPGYGHQQPYTAPGSNSMPESWPSHTNTTTSANQYAGYSPANSHTMQLTPTGSTSAQTPHFGGGPPATTSPNPSVVNLLDLDIFTDAPIDLNVEELFFEQWPQMDWGARLGEMDMSGMFNSQQQ